MKMAITGIEDINRVFTSIAPAEAKNLMRAVVFDISKTAAGIAISNTPDDPATTGGDLKSSIKPKRERGTRNRIEASVVVTNIKRNFFWRFLEYAQGPDKVEHAMFLKTIDTMRPGMAQIYKDAFVKKLLARLARARK